MTSIRQMIITLFVVAVTCAIILSFVYAFTEPRIAETQAQLTLSGLEEVITAYEYKVIIPDTLWQAVDSSGENIGVVFRVFPQGYAGPIPITVGLDNDGKITGIRVASAAEGLVETPGLGAKITQPGFTEQFKGKTATDVALEQEGGSIDAITAATISSRAVATGVKKGIEMYGACLMPSCDPGIVFSDADKFVEVIKDTLWKAVRGSDTLGVVFVRVVQGYLDDIKFMVGYSAEKRITGISILYSQETEGLGEVIREEEFLEKFKIGIPEAISGATVSTKALINGVVKGIERFEEYIE
ncbi:MAG: RnfABCDGE type electron transport complex subunit G [candidate division WOR-3 bacterium]|nr:RnfABCDGE type electron transport complex subunit G [candidate division WOR-3 bacterium]